MHLESFKKLNTVGCKGMVGKWVRIQHISQVGPNNKGPPRPAHGRRLSLERRERPQKDHYPWVQIMTGLQRDHSWGRAEGTQNERRPDGISKGPPAQTSGRSDELRRRQWKWREAVGREAPKEVKGVRLIDSTEDDEASRMSSGQLSG